MSKLISQDMSSHIKSLVQNPRSGVISDTVHDILARFGQRLFEVPWATPQL
jgi:hypothetical protein